MFRTLIEPTRSFKSLVSHFVMHHSCLEIEFRLCHQIPSYLAYPLHVYTGECSVFPHKQSCKECNCVSLQELQGLSEGVTEMAESHRAALLDELQRQTSIVHGFHQQIMNILPVQSQGTLSPMLVDKQREPESPSTAGSQ